MGTIAMTNYSLSIFVLAVATILTACGSKTEQNNANPANAANPNHQEQVVIATVPQPNNCLQPSQNRYGQPQSQRPVQQPGQQQVGQTTSYGNQTQAWVPYAQSGFVPYSWSYNGGWQTQPQGYQQGYPQGYSTQYATQYWNTNGYCGCPGGYIPACDGSVGLVCAPVAYDNSYRYAAYGWGGNGSFAFSGYFGYSYGTSFGWTSGHMPTYSHGYGRYSRQRTCHMQVSQSCVVGSNSCGYGTCLPTVSGSRYGVCVTR